MASFDVEIGQRMRTLRQAADVSKATAGEIADISVQKVELYESGMLRTPSRTLLQLSYLFDVPLRCFFDHEVEARPGKRICALQSFILDNDIQSADGRTARPGD